MDFAIGLPFIASRKNVIWVVVDRLTKSAHFIAIQDSWMQIGWLEFKLVK